MLEARDLTVRYPGSGRHALDGVSFVASRGKLLALAGPNGSGKTTLVRALLGLLHPERGDSLVDGRPVMEWTRGDLARVIGVVPQREEIVFPLRVDEMVMLGRYARLRPMSAPGPTDRAAVSQALARCDASHLAARRVDELSGGEWQRVRLARALAQEPRMLVLDEPTVSLDIRHEMELFELVRNLVDAGMGGLVVTHQLNLAARFADEIVLLDRDRVVRAGPPADVLTADVVAQVFDWPVAVTPWREGSPQIVPLRPREFPQP